MDTPSFSAGEPTPRPRLPKWQLLRCPPSEWRLEATIVSRHVTAVETHFEGGRRKLCWQNECPLILHAKPRRWYGYFQVVVPNISCVGILEVTEECYRQMKEYSVSSDNAFRGLVFKLHRPDKKRNSRIDVTPLDLLCGVLPLPDELDIWPMIMKLYRVT